MMILHRAESRLSASIAADRFRQRGLNRSDRSLTGSAGALEGRRSQRSLQGAGRSGAQAHRTQQSSGFSIRVNFKAGLDNLNTSARKAIESAAQFWQRVVTGSVGGPKTVVITIRGQALRSRTLATATPTVLNALNFPTKGVTTINTRLSRVYNQNPRYLKETIIHEFAHVLGVGTLWADRVDAVTATYRADSQVGLAYGLLLGQSTPVAVPLDADLGHWDEVTFGNELMTPTDNGRQTRDPLSVLTIAALEDLGWTVNYNAAQRYQLPSL